MPLYEFKCEQCGLVFEHLQKMSDPLPEDCGVLNESCSKKSAVRKLISQTSFQLKGGGWYTDGYGSTSKKTSGAAAPASSSDKKEDAPKPSEAKDSKPAAKKDPPK